MSRLKSMATVLDHLLYAIPKNVSIFVSLSINATGTKVFPYYRFLCSEEKSFREQPLLKNKFRSTVDLYHQIVDDFFEGSLCSVYDTVIKLDQEYLGICLENINKEKLNLYYSKDALYLYDEMKKKVEEKKCNDFCEFGKEHLENYRIKRMVFYPAVDDRSSVIYIFDNEEYNSLRKQRQFGFYYRKSGNCIDSYDLEAMLALIRYFITIQIDADPIYIYETNYSQLSSEKNGMCSF